MVFKRGKTVSSNDITYSWFVCFLNSPSLSLTVMTSFSLCTMHPTVADWNNSMDFFKEESLGWDSHFKHFFLEILCLQNFYVSISICFWYQTKLLCKMKRLAFSGHVQDHHMLCYDELSSCIARRLILRKQFFHSLKKVTEASHRRKRQSNSSLLFCY